MTAYVIAEMDVTDPTAYEAYKSAASVAIKQHGGRYLSRGGRSVSFEGDGSKRIVVVEFDSIEAAQRWYNSADYQAAKGLRANSAKGRLYVVEAL